MIGDAPIILFKSPRRPRIDELSNEKTQKVAIQPVAIQNPADFEAVL